MREAGEVFTVKAEFCNSEFAYRGWHLYTNGQWVRGMLEHDLMKACGFDPVYGNTPAHTDAWWKFVDWFVETYPKGASFKALPFGALELLEVAVPLPARP